MEKLKILTFNTTYWGDGNMYAILLRGDIAYGFLETTEEQAAEFQCEYVLVEELPTAFIDIQSDQYVKYVNDEFVLVTVEVPVSPPSDADKIAQLEQQLAQTNQDLAAVLEMILSA